MCANIGTILLTPMSTAHARETVRWILTSSGYNGNFGILVNQVYYLNMPGHLLLTLLIDVITVNPEITET
jgi:hypothetical protein